MQAFHLHSLMFEGNIMVKWREQSLVTDEALTESTATFYTHIPLHYRSPWRPMLLKVRLIAASSEYQSQEFEVIEDDMNALTQLEPFLMELDEGEAWQMTMMTLSSKQWPCRHIQGQCYAMEIPDASSLFWKGAAVERRMQRKRRPVSTITSLQGLDALDPHPTQNPIDIEHNLGAVTEGEEIADDEMDIDNYYELEEEDALQDLCGENGVFALWAQAQLQSEEPQADGLAAGMPASSSAGDPSAVAPIVAPPPVPCEETSSSSSGSSSSTSLGAPHGRNRQTPLDTDEVDWRPLKAYTLMNKFRITPKPPQSQGGGGGAYGGYSSTCPFHYKSAFTQCKKWSPLLGGTQAHRKEALARLIEWLLAGPQCSRQREHVAMSLTQDPAELPSVSALHARVRAIQLPAVRPADDRALDAAQGVNPDAAPKRVASKRLTRPRT